VTSLMENKTAKWRAFIANSETSDEYEFLTEVRGQHIQSYMFQQTIRPHVTSRNHHAARRQQCGNWCNDCGHFSFPL